MNPFKNRALLFCSLLIYTLSLTAALLYFRFPAEEVKLFFQTKMEQLLPRTQCSVAKMSYRFPLSVTINEMDFKSRQGKKESLCTIDQVTISPQLSSLTSHFHVDINAWDGEHSFSLVLQQAEKKFTMEDIQLHGLDLAKVPFLQQTFGREITGSLSGNGTYHGGWNKKGSPAEGKGNIVIDTGSFSLLLPIFSLEKIDLKKLTAEVVLQKNRLQFDKGSFHGQELKGEFSGNLGLQSPLKRSGFSFKGALEPLPPLLKKSKYAQDMVIQLKKQHARATLPFLLQGSVESPKFKFDS
ncbi:MAG: type II secretion system protein GspN [Desulfocapsa sp.]|nr:type II secretion system protein GspN [Desulfocapsa sp.]